MGRQSRIVLHAEACADLAAMKLLAVAQRGTKKDFIDVHALSRQMPLPRMLDCYQRRFGVTATSRIIAGALQPRPP